MALHLYRSHNCGALRNTDVGKVVRLSGWVHRKRDHGNLLFVDLRDHYGVTQCVVEQNETTFTAVNGVRAESVVTILGRVVARSPETVNAALPTGSVEVRIESGWGVRDIGRALHRPAVSPVPAFALRLLYGEMAEMVTEGQRAVPERTLAGGFQFRHPDLDEALASALA